jgi:hypothetical protein
MLEARLGILDKNQVIAIPCFQKDQTDSHDAIKPPTQGQVLSAPGGHQWVGGLLSEAPVVAF